MSGFVLTKDQQDLKRLAAEFGKQVMLPAAKEYDLLGETPLEIYKQAVEIGFASVALPAEYGGLGMDMTTQCLLTEELSRWEAGITNALGASSLASKPIMIAGTPAQKQYAVDMIQSGHLAAFGLTEPDAGSDAAALKTTAVRRDGGYVLNGRKCFITMAPIASHCIVYAKTSPEKGAKGISCFLVDMALPGVSCGRHEEKMGQRGVPVSDVLLEDVRVPKSCMVGERDLGFVNAMRTLSVGRIGIASMCLGMAQEAIELAVSHTKNRVQFGKPLCRHQAIAFMLADMETRLNAARGLVYQAAWLLDNRQPADKAASMAKLYAAEAAISIINQSLQLHGGYGYSREYEIERLYRDVRVCAIYEGSSQVQQMVISGQMLK